MTRLLTVVYERLTRGVGARCDANLFGTSTVARALPNHRLASDERKGLGGEPGASVTRGDDAEDAHLLLLLPPAFCSSLRLWLRLCLPIGTLRLLLRGLSLLATCANGGRGGEDCERVGCLEKISLYRKKREKGKNKNARGKGGTSSQHAPAAARLGAMFWS